ncbi:hypothetical protein [Paenibacillus thalictri]|uniref:Uncharacterized protein n=1 Tax=Paenibacillus thalictri TaxID=2527873 RepID=A0A4Q9DQT8_9BACL|nr:hypothetical protein [Paenibacillus thalictri]TBL77752.1 hypothetical protein EYB31_16550 [Paenibacillus thalictri]
MIGSIRWNLVLGLITFICTGLFSFSSNIWTTTLLNSVYSFVLVFALVFLVRWFLGTVIGLNKVLAEETELSQAEEAIKGTALDVVTPDEGDSINQLLKDGLGPQAKSNDDSFAPLAPPKLKSKTDLEPDDLAKALRQMSEE